MKILRMKCMETFQIEEFFNLKCWDFSFFKEIHIKISKLFHAFFTNRMYKDIYKTIYQYL
jgi:hypothetical protein